MDYDKTDIPANYDRARDHGPAFLRHWMQILANHVEPDSVTNILDLGCGTGRFSNSLAERFRAGVIGIDPSTKMLREARNRPGVERVSYLVGAAEALPLAAESVDFIFISMVFHHFGNSKTAVQECRRVLRPDGRVCLRTGSSDKIDQYPYAPFFPGTRSLLEARLPSLTVQQRAFDEAGFQTVSSNVVVQEIAPDYFAYADKLAVKADSILIRLNDSEFDSGMKALRSFAATTTARPITEPIDLLVFRKH
jgi:ubiquinone/menaquinone biosynthesis C-methylase UbiE